ncbi:MAG: ABC transporter ATP-binding protein [Thiohalobacteraceae bacterium]
MTEPALTSPLLEIDQLSVRYGDVAVVEALSCGLAQGRIGCLLGPSGCGKTTVLRAIAGFEPVATGEIRLRGKVVSRPDWALAPERRQVGMVFQDFALFPHLSIADNVAFGIRKLGPAQRDARVAELLDLVGLGAYARVYPHQLSGGQQQRVALARAIAPRPNLLLMDEPFSSMDVELREQLAREVRGILRHEGITAVLVTHDQMEAFAMADEIGVMHRGRLEQWGSAYDLYHRPVSRFVADFIGQGVLLPGKVLNANQVETELGIITGKVAADMPPDTAVDVLIRPDDIIHDDASPWLTQVCDKAFRGAEFLYTLCLSSGAKILSLVPSHHDHAIGERIGIRVDIDHLVMFRRAG